MYNKDLVIKNLRAIEHEKDVTIVYACPAGSRAYGLETDYSDYDVRFIYKYGVERYLSLFDPQDTIERKYDNMELSGWDVKKALGLLLKSNPSLYEMLYIESEPFINKTEFSAFMDVKDHYYSLSECCKHYFGMALHNYHKYLVVEHEGIILPRPEINHKKYLMVIRPLLMVKFMLEYRSRPPLMFNKLFSTCTLTSCGRMAIAELMQRRQEAPLPKWGGTDVLIDHFLREEMPKLRSLDFNEVFQEHKKVSPREADAAFRAIIV